jgi:hypothetical protein
MSRGKASGCKTVVELLVLNAEESDMLSWISRGDIYKAGVVTVPSLRHGTW